MQDVFLVRVRGASGQASHPQPYRTVAVWLWSCVYYNTRQASGEPIYNERGSAPMATIITNYTTYDLAYYYAAPGPYYGGWGWRRGYRYGW